MILDWPFDLIDLPNNEIFLAKTVTLYQGLCTEGYERHYDYIVFNQRGCID